MGLISMREGIPFHCLLYEFEDVVAVRRDGHNAEGSRQIHAQAIQKYLPFL